MRTRESKQETLSKIEREKKEKVKEENNAEKI